MNAEERTSRGAGDIAERLRRLGVRRGVAAPPSSTTPVASPAEAPPASSMIDADADAEEALRQRLRRLLGGGGATAAAGGFSGGRSSVDASRSKAPPGARVTRAEGLTHVAESEAPRGDLFGAAPLDACFDARARVAAIAGRDPRLAEADPKRWVYFDIETTSLNSGAGVWVFLVGVGRFEDDVFRVRQHLLLGPESEAAFLAAIEEDFATASAVVSFHGKSFDAPRLDDRRRLASLSEICARLPHWDLLHATRRLFGPVWPDCKLRTVEERLLEFRRVDDLPGAECPAHYFAFLRGGRHRMADVVEHNRHDVRALAALAGKLAEIYEAPPERDALWALVSGLDYAKAGNDAEASLRLSAGVSAAGHLSVAQRDNLRRKLRRYGDRAAADKVAELGLPVALGSAAPHDSRSRFREGASGAPDRRSRPDR